MVVQGMADQENITVYSYVFNCQPLMRATISIFTLAVIVLSTT